MNLLPGTAAPLSQHGFDAVRENLRVVPSSLWSLLTVETNGFGFMPDRRLEMLFERHVFHRRTEGAFSEKHPDISAKRRGGYKSGAAEYARLGRAMALDHDAALESASWGMGQVMGFNAKSLGYQNAEAMVNTFREGEGQQLEAVGRHIHTRTGLAEAFRAGDWPEVARLYNGSAHALKGYDAQLSHYFTHYSTKGPPDIRTRIAQARLTFLGYKPRGVDGIIGDGTLTAIIAFQKAHHLAVTAQLDDATFGMLAQQAASLA